MPCLRAKCCLQAVLSAFAALLLSAFLAGFKDAAERKAKEAGEKVFDYLWEAISDLFSNKKESKAKKELEKRASDALRIVGGLTEEQLTRLLTEVEKELKIALQNKLSSGQADKLAGRVRQSVLKHILSDARYE